MNFASTLFKIIDEEGNSSYSSSDVNYKSINEDIKITGSRLNAVRILFLFGLGFGFLL